MHKLADGFSNGVAVDTEVGVEVTISPLVRLLDRGRREPEMGPPYFIAQSGPLVRVTVAATVHVLGGPFHKHSQFISVGGYEHG